MSENHAGKSGVVPLATAAAVLGVDVQTLRLMLREGVVDFGAAWRRPGSKRWSYLVFAKPFERVTGYKAGAEVRRC